MSDRPYGREPGCAQGFVEVGGLEQLPAGSALRALVGDHAVAVVNAGGRLAAIGDLCMRCGSSLAEGQLLGRQLTCGACGWRYDLDEGCVVGLPSLHVETHEVRVDGRRIFVGIGALPSATR
jgi:nitrite reductase/ring-hydroxylating ferredoxin subunit